MITISLLEAAEARLLSTVRYLVGKHVGKVKREISRATEAGSLDIVAEFLVQESDDCHNNIKIDLLEAAKAGILEAVEYLVKKKGVDVNVKYDQVNGKYECGTTPLHLAANRGKLDVVKYLVQHAAEVSAADGFGNTPLHAAVGDQHLDVVKYLVDKGANVNAKKKNGITVLYRAVSENNLDVVKYLVEEGGAAVNVEKKDYTRIIQKTVIRKSVVKGKDKCIIESVTNTDIGPLNDSTPLHAAAIFGYLDIVQYLVDKGADINARDECQMTPLDQAGGYKRSDIVAYLTGKGAECGRFKPNRVETLKRNGDHISLS